MKKINENFTKKLKEIYSKEDIEICEKWFNTEKRKVCFRVNTLKSDVQTVLKELEENWLKVEKIDFLENSFFLVSGTEKDLWNLKIFEKGFIYMQWISSQIPAIVLNPKENKKILDLTAAPWAKTSQLASIVKNTWEIIANDNNAIRIEKLNFTLKRQWVKNTEIIKTDARKVLEKSPRFIEYFDYIVADLPCSAEWKFNFNIEKSFWYWDEKTNKRNYRLQKDIVQWSLSMLKIWWELVYSTCTISPEENEALVHTILCNNENIELIDFNIDYKYARSWILEYWKQKYKKEISKTKRILPSEESEWFYIAKFKRIS